MIIITVTRASCGGWAPKSYVAYQSSPSVSNIYPVKSGINPGVGYGGNIAATTSAYPISQIAHYHIRKFTSNNSIWTQCLNYQLLMYNGERRPSPKRIWSVFGIESGFDPEPDEFQHLVDRHFLVQWYICDKILMKILSVFAQTRAKLRIKMPHFAVLKNFIRNSNGVKCWTDLSPFCHNPRVWQT